MSKQEIVSAQLEKSESLWSMNCDLKSHKISTGVWSTTQWQLLGFELQPDSYSENTTTLQLHRDERTDYRFNLSSQQPKLFLILDAVDNEEQPHIVSLTASQSAAGQYMDGDYLVLSNEMPLPVQAWIEAYIGRHGELLEVRRKKRKGAGRSSGK
ncbi:DUF3305 domain-containing protein [Vibrio coralliilyticus]|uniref:DUF3305 domain-containing protein n=1 Tax=Vibrio coralliilyticus TaxID=190893 RepID=UPI0017F038F7|nr:DUF3305 domain-containing protein [Vibrio coralliilyticus]NUW67497.1 DUF3305 domain-containing protein [Vibrio coralliilyticus]